MSRKLAQGRHRIEEEIEGKGELCCAIMNIESQICSEELIVMELSITSHVRAIVFEEMIIGSY
jgi:hypothetical protein